MIIKRYVNDEVKIYYAKKIDDKESSNAMASLNLLLLFFLECKNETLISKDGVTNVLFLSLLYTLVERIDLIS